MDANQRERFQRIISEATSIALRTVLLIILDFTINGALITYAVNNLQEIIAEKPNVYDLLFSLERQNITELWSELSWTSYCFWSLLYTSIIVIGITLFFIDTDVLLTWTAYIGPSIIAIASFIFSLEDAFNAANPKRTTNDDEAYFKRILIFCYRTSIRGLYGYVAGRFYYSWRLRSPITPVLSFFVRFFDVPSVSIIPGQPIVDKAITWLFLRSPFFVPLLYPLCSALGFPKAVDTVIVLTIFTPLLLFETFSAFVLLSGLIVPYYYRLSRVRIGLMVARPNLLMNLQNWAFATWARLRIPSVFRTFFISRISFHLTYVLYAAIVLGPDNDPYGIFAKRTLTTDWLWTGGMITTDRSSSSGSNEHSGILSWIVSALEYLLARSCETCVAIMGMTSVITVCGHWSGVCFHWLLTGEYRRNRHGQRHDQEHVDENELDEDRESVGTLTGVLFMVLCVQTGLTTLPAEKRLWKLYRNLWLLSMAVLHLVHHMVNSTMTRLCTHGRFHWTKHLRACLLGLFLLFAPYLFFKSAWRHNNWVNPWLLSVAIFAVELTAKMFISFVVYALMLFDLCYPRLAMEEVLYGVKSTGSILDFAFGLCLLINGIWILFYEHGGLLRTFMICIHGYFNIYQRAKKGWAQLRRRRLATKKLNTLQTATRERLSEAKDEVCAICYVELNSEEDATGSWTTSEVKVTACGHLLHAACLLKWLYIRDACPLCHRTVFDDESLVDSTNDMAHDLDDD